MYLNENFHPIKHWNHISILKFLMKLIISNNLLKFLLLNKII